MAFKIVPDEDVSMLMRPPSDLTAKSFIAGRDPEPLFAMPLPPDAMRGIRRNLQQEICNLDNEDDDTLALPTPSSKDLVQVYLRVKPKTIEEERYPETSQDQLDKACPDAMIRIESAHQLCVEAPIDSAAFKNSVNGNGKLTHRFSFTKIFSSSTSQAELFDDVVKPRLRDCLEGQNQLLFTYGATCSGKTFTIQGDSTRPGIVPRALDVLFNSIGSQSLDQDEVNMRPLGYNRVGALLPREKEKVISDKKAIMDMGTALSQALDVAEDCSDVSQTSIASLSSRRRDENVIDVKGSHSLHYAVWVSFAEVYNENIYDLFEKIPEVKNKSEKPRRNPLKLANDDKGWSYIKCLKEVPVSSADEAYQLLLIGRQSLQFAATRLNHHSSRSHCVFTIKIVRVADKAQPTSARVSVLSFCDLAGSERIKKTLNTGDRQKEAGSINTSLLVLGRCIKTIRQNQLSKDPKRQQIVPFRESKLTNLFKSYLTGTGKVSMVVNISQSPYLFDESLQVLKFSAVASKVHIEQIKEPKAKPTPQERQSKRKTRFSILVESNKPFMAGGRGSIAWENPQYRSTICPQPIDQTVLEETEIADETVIDANYNGLMKVIDNLKNQLIEEKQKNLRQEQEIRTELCEEFNKMLVEIEASSEQRLQEEKDRASELSEWRISKLEEALREKRESQRRRHESDGPALEEKEAEIQRLKEELNAIKTLHNSLLEDNKKTQSDKNALKSELKAANETNEMLESRVQHLEKTVESTNEALKSQTSDPKIRDLEAKVQDSLKTLNDKENQIRDLKTLLDEAGEDYLKMDNEIKKHLSTISNLQRTVDLKEEAIRDLEVQCDELKALSAEATTRAEEKELLIFEMEEKLEAFAAPSEKEEEKWSAKMASEQQITNLNDEIEALKSEKKKLRSTLDCRDADLASKEKEIEALEHETKRLVQIENQAQEKGKWHEKEVGSLRKQLKEITTKLTEAEKEAKDKKNIIANLELAVAASKKEDTAIDALKTELDTKRAEVEEAQHQAAKLQSSVEAMEYDTKRLKDDREQLMAHYEQKLKKVTEDLHLERRETSKLREVMQHTTPIKRETTNELNVLREELAKKSEFIKTLAAKVTTPKRTNEEGDESKAIEALEEKHKREMQRQEERYAKIIAEFRDTNTELLKHVEKSAAKRIMKTKRYVEDSDDENVPPSSSSKQEKSTIEATPAANESNTSSRTRKGKRGRKKMSATTQVSFDDDVSVSSNILEDTESPEENSLAKRPRRGARVSRNSRPTRKYGSKSGEDTSIDTTHEPNESASTLQAIQENSTFQTPANRKRKLFTNTPKPNVFTPQEEDDNAPVDSPHSVVRRQLRSRNNKKKT